jgi:preprotein translocase subunit YajC
MKSMVKKTVIGLAIISLVLFAMLYFQWVSDQREMFQAFQDSVNQEDTY